MINPMSNARNTATKAADIAKGIALLQAEAAAYSKKAV